MEDESLKLAWKEYKKNHTPYNPAACFGGDCLPYKSPYRVNPNNIFERHPEDQKEIDKLWIRIVNNKKQ